MNYPNVVVLNVYLDVIKEALVRLNYECEYIKDFNGISKQDLIVFPMGKDAFKYYFKGYRNFILWQQGATGAESFMRHSSKIRSGILNYMDCFAMKKAKMIFYVSQYMQEYYEKMAHTSFEHKAYVMPCFNEVLDKELLEKKDYSKKVFTYVGSLDLWQCFNETVDIYAEIEKRIPDVFFKVLTFNTEKAKEIIKAKNITNYSVACVPKEQVKSELENATYGFIIRHDIEVNRVATPTKISSYLSAGVLPIYSTCLKDFHAQAHGKAFAYALNPKEDIDGLIQFINSDLDKSLVQQEIDDLFSTYYSKDYHVSNIIHCLAGCLNM
jgi:hypothetical protein